MRLIVWFLALATLVLGIWIIWGGSWDRWFTFEGTVRWLGRSGHWAWAAGIGLLVSDLVLPVPGTVVISALGYIYGMAVGGLIAAVGLTAAGLTGYGIGRLCGEKFAKGWLGEKDYEKGRVLFVNGGGWVVALSRALPVLPEVISCTAGLVRMPFRRFFVALVCGSLPMGFVFAGIGRVGHDSPTLAFAASLLLPAVLWLMARRFVR